MYWFVYPNILWFWFATSDCIRYLFCILSLFIFFLLHRYGLLYETFPLSYLKKSCCFETATLILFLVIIWFPYYIEQREVVPFTNSFSRSSLYCGLWIDYFTISSIAKILRRPFLVNKNLGLFGFWPSLIVPWLALASKICTIVLLAPILDDFRPLIPLTVSWLKFFLRNPKLPLYIYSYLFSFIFFILYIYIYI